jgi:hypothetical protein
MAEEFEEKRQKGKQRGIDEAFKEGQRTYNEGIPVIRYLENQINKGLTYDPDARKALKDGYNSAKSKEKEKGKKAGGRIKLEKGGALKPPPNKGAASLPEGVRNSMGFMKKGGKVKAKKMKKCRMDGIAIRGKTRAKQRSK